MHQLECHHGPEFVSRHLVTISAEQPTTIPRHQHCDYEFIYLHAGDYAYRHNEFSNRLLPGQGLLLRPGDWHIDHLTAGTVYSAVNFVLKNESSSLLKDQSVPEAMVINDKDGRLARILRDMQEENTPSDVFSVPLCEIYIRELYWRILRLLPREMVKEKIFQSSDNQNFIKEMQRVSKQQIRTLPSLKFLAEQLHLSPRTLNNRCHELLGASPLKTFMQIKMEFAHELLTRTAMSVKEISDYLGFQNPYHFSKVFKRVFLTPPASIRHQYGRKS